MRVERPWPSANVRPCVPTPAGHTRAELFEASHQETATDLADHAALRPTQERRIERPRAQAAITCASAVNASIRSSCGAAASPSHAPQGARPTTAIRTAFISSKLRYAMRSDLRWPSNAHIGSGPLLLR